MFATFGELKASRAIEIAGVSPTSNSFKSLLNQATQQLLNRGDFVGTVAAIYICAKNGCIVWPRYVGAVRKLNRCHQPIPIRSTWYDFFEQNDYTSWQTCGWLERDCLSSMIAYGRTPLFTDIQGDGRYVRLYHTVNADLGKKVTIFGLDNNGQVLRRHDPATGTWYDGIELVAQHPYAQTDIYIRRIDRVLKDTTQGDLRLYAYNVADVVLEDLAIYEPSETNPAYSRYQLHSHGCCTTNCDTSVGYAALVKLKFIPVTIDQDVVLIQNIPALKYAMEAIKAEEGGNDGVAEMKWKKAVRELNLELSNETPDDQVAVSISPFGSTLIGEQHCM